MGTWKILGEEFDGGFESVVFLSLISVLAGGGGRNNVEGWLDEVAGATAGPDGKPKLLRGGTAGALDAAELGAKGLAGDVDSDPKRDLDG